MKIRLNPRILTLVLIIILIPLTAIMIFPTNTVAATPSLTENFSNNAFNSSIWKTFQQGTGPSVTIANQSLLVTIPTGSTNDPTT